MTSAQIKLQLNKTIDGLSASNLKKVYGLVTNYINSKSDDDEYASDVSAEEIEAIEAGLEDLRKGKKIPHKEVMERIRNKYQK